MCREINFCADGFKCSTENRIQTYPQSPPVFKCLPAAVSWMVHGWLETICNKIGTLSAHKFGKFLTSVKFAGDTFFGCVEITLKRF